MTTRLALLAALFVAAGGIAAAAEPKPRSFRVPFRTTIPKHIVVRVKINGKGPFNFILDTGAPAMFIATKVGKLAGLKNGPDGWAVMDKLEIEGGIVLPKAQGRVETPFQLEGMNGMGLAGVEIHGLMGYSILAAYKMEIDFTKDKMTWTENGKMVPLPKRIRKGGGGAGGLEMMGTIMKQLGGVLGRKASPFVTLRGFHGMTLVNGDEYPTVSAVVAGGPAGKAGLKTGDIVTKVGGRTVSSVEDVLRFAKDHAPGKTIKLTVRRAGETKEITFKTAEGI
jgi:hypothetical protein